MTTKYTNSKELRKVFSMNTALYCFPLELIKIIKKTLDKFIISILTELTKPLN